MPLERAPNSALNRTSARRLISLLARSPRGPKPVSWGRYAASAECYTFSPMKLVTGRVENGKVVLPEGEFEEGAAVAVLASTTDEPVGLTSAEQEALIESLSAIRSGDYVTGED